MSRQQIEDPQSLERWQIIDQNFTKKVLSLTPQSAQSAQIDRATFVNLFTQQIITRHIDLLARILKAKNLGFYTIASAGHENNIAFAHIFKIQDPALLHYRSSAFMLNRAFKHGGEIGLENQILEQIKSLLAAKSDKISNGRHKVFGSVELNVPPQTSTIASHLPKAVGLALSINQNRILKNNLKNNPGVKFPTLSNSVVLCSFGDASFNHSTAQGAINAARILSYQHVPLPLVFICEDNNIGISVKTPQNWIENNFTNLNVKNNITYLSADGLNLLDVIEKAKLAEKIARVDKVPVFLHMKTVRLMGHAGSDIEQHYLSLAEIQSNEDDDPLLYTASLALGLDYFDCTSIIGLYETIREKILRLSANLINEPKLGSAQEVMASIIPSIPRLKTPRVLGQKTSENIFGAITPTWQTPRNMAQALNLVFAETLAQYPNTVFFGEDVGKKGGVYRLTAGLQEYFGRKRIFDTILDEQTIIGTAVGFGHNNILPIIEIQFLAYLHNAIDQLRGEAATLSFFSGGRLANPMIIRLPGLAYQKGFGGHFHNDNSFTALRDIPGIIIACPSNAQSAVKIWRRLVKTAYSEMRICVFIEPIALYFTKDLLQPNDNKMLTVYSQIDERLPEMGQISVTNYLVNDDSHSNSLIIISYGNGHFLSVKAIDELKTQYKINKSINNISINNISLVDLCWLKPLPIDNIYNIVLNQGKTFSCVNILIVDECRNTGSISEEIIAKLYSNCQTDNLLSKVNLFRITAEDSFIPLGPAADHVLPSVKSITDKILKIGKIC
ncbi:MAG: MFS transporter [Gammaproteobacteria bacterium]|nr:MFS transporter [Gammaproteobacteria bacterium]